METVPLSGPKGAGRVTLVDDGDYAIVTPHRWFLREIIREGRRPNGPYAVAHIYIDGHRTFVYMHKFITGWPRTDHIDHDGLNNQRYNLRPATHGQNMQHSRPNLRPGSSKYKGVYWYGRRNNQWFARIVSNGKQIHLGGFRNEVDAALAYDAAARELHGAFAMLNFPQVMQPPSAQPVLL